MNASRFSNIERTVASGRVSSIDAFSRKKRSTSSGGMVRPDSSLFMLSANRTFGVVMFTGPALF